MVGHCKRTCEDRTCLTVLALAVAEEQGICSRIVMAKMTCLSDEAAGEHDSILNLLTAGDDEVVTDDAHSHMHRSFLITVDASVLQT